MRPSCKSTSFSTLSCSDSMLAFGDKISLAGFDAWIVQGNDWNLHDIELTRSDFGFDSRYSDLAKLYTFPYSMMRITDGSRSLDVKIQDITKGANARAHAILSTLDFLTILEGIGGYAAGSLDAKKLDGSTLDVEIPSGQWQQWILDSKIPTYSIYLSNSQSRAIDDYTADMVVTRNAAIAAYHNANRANSGAYHNAVDAANASIANCATQTGANTSITNLGNSFNTTAEGINSTKISNDATADGAFSALGNLGSGMSDMLTFVVSQSANAQSAGINLLGDLASLHIGQAITGWANWGISAAQASASYAIARSQDAVTNSTAGAAMHAKVSNALTALSGLTTAQNSTSSAITSASNNSATTQNARSNKVNKDNAWYSCEDAHYAGYNDLSIAQQRIYGKYRDLKRSGNTAMVSDSGDKIPDSLMLRGIDFQILTQSDGAIQRAGDEFLRYGYRYDRAWDFQTWNIMEHFTYWQVRDIWIAKGSIPEFAIRILRDDLRNGITIWRDIDSMFSVSIYENGVV